MQAEFCWSLRGLIYHFTLSVRFPIARVDNCTLSQGMYIEKSENRIMTNIPLLLLMKLCCSVFQEKVIRCNLSIALSWRAT